MGNRSYIRLSSNDATAANRSIILSDGLVRGQLIIIQNAVVTGSFQIADTAGGSNADTAGVRDFGFGDVIMLLWNGSTWFEISYTDS